MESKDVDLLKDEIWVHVDRILRDKGASSKDIHDAIMSFKSPFKEKERNIVRTTKDGDEIYFEPKSMPIVELSPEVIQLRPFIMPSKGFGFDEVLSLIQRTIDAKVNSQAKL